MICFDAFIKENTINQIGPTYLINHKEYLSLTFQIRKKQIPNITHPPNTDKIYLYAKNLFEAKH